jgi:hypothetical protein
VHTAGLSLTRCSIGLTRQRERERERERERKERKENRKERETERKNVKAIRQLQNPAVDHPDLPFTQEATH